MRNRFSTLATLAVLSAAVFAVGCGRYDPDAAEYPKNYDAVPPPPPATQEELAAQQDARAEEGAAQKSSPEVAIGADQNEYADTDPSALTEFKPALDNHGTWVDDSTYGTVWVPSSSEVGADFQPYVTAGHWTYSDETDYVWVSDYEWGWAPFHYGRWVSMPDGRWGWIAGRRYSGAWVTWRTGPSGYGYVGWAPMAPDYYWSSGFAVGWTYGFYHPYDYYVYCPREHFYGPVGTYVVRGPAAHEYYGRTHDYIPASPVVGGRVPANPSVGGAGPGRVVATPSVGGVHGAASGAVAARGPRPDELGVKHDVVVPPPASHQGLTRAQAMATPASSIAHGGSVPMQAPHTTTAFADRPASTAYVPRSSFAAHAATASPSRPTEAYRGGSPSVSPSHVATTSAPTYRPRTSSSYRSSSPSVSAPRVSSSPSPRVSRPASSFRSSTPTFARPSAPAMRAPSAPSPAFHSAAPSVMHSAPAAASRPAAVRSGSSGKKR